MTNQLLDKIAAGEEIRQSLISLRAELKKNQKARKECLAYIARINVFLELFSQEDAKIRKNCALILGELLSCPECVKGDNGQYQALAAAAEEALYNAYVREQQLFVRPAYLEALIHLNSSAYKESLAEVLALLVQEETNEESRKHRAEERKLLRELAGDGNGNAKHSFTGYDCPAEIVLLTNRNHIHVTAEKIKCKEKREFNAGIRLCTDSLREITDIRTYEELLFVVPGMSSCPADPAEAAKVIAGSGLIPFLERRHKEQGQPYRFRIEQKGNPDPEKKSRFIHRMAAELESLTKNRLINSTGEYEIEIRMVQSREERYNLLLKLYTLNDRRFEYRKETVAAAIRPVNAALTLALVKDYLQPDAQVLDPFCGVGTMLIERAKLGCEGLGVRNLYGIDSFGEAIGKAKINTEAAGLHANYINRNFFDFKHQYLFDEVIADMPFVQGKEPGRQKEEELAQLYRDFFIKIQEHMKEDGVLILYTRNRELVYRYGGRKPFRIEKEYEISMREKTYVFVLRFYMPA